VNLAHINSLCSHAGINTNLAERPEREGLPAGKHISYDVSTYNNSSTIIRSNRDI
jgi:hypothetical protein